MNAELTKVCRKIYVSDSTIQTAPSIVRLFSKSLTFFVKTYVPLDTVAQETVQNTSF